MEEKRSERETERDAEWWRSEREREKGRERRHLRLAVRSPWLRFLSMWQVSYTPCHVENLACTHTRAHTHLVFSILQPSNICAFIGRANVGCLKSGSVSLMNLKHNLKQYPICNYFFFFVFFFYRCSKINIF